MDREDEICELSHGDARALLENYDERIKSLEARARKAEDRAYSVIGFYFEALAQRRSEWRRANAAESACKLRGKTIARLQRRISRLKRAAQNSRTHAKRLEQCLSAFLREEEKRLAEPPAPEVTAEVRDD